MNIPGISALFKTDRQDRFDAKRAAVYRSLLRQEAKIGGQLFGPVRKGGRREFFCMDPNTWIWHEEWIDENGKRQIRTTRYDVRPNGILKAQNTQHYQLVSLEEADNLCSAIEAYARRVGTEVYGH